MKTIIQSFSDIITNSSSEVFVSEKSEDLINILKQLNIHYECYEDETSLREDVEAYAWDFEKILDFNPYQEIWMEDLKNHKSSDEIWDFFKVFYIKLLGKIIVNEDRDYIYQQEDKYDVSLNKYRK